MKNTRKIVSIPPGITHKLVNKYPSLTPVELKVSALVALNLSSREIAGITGRSIRTIEYTRNNIRKKMECNSEESLINHILLTIND